MTVDSNKYTSLLSNLEVELIVKLQNYLEFFSLSYLIVFGEPNDVKSIVSQCIYTLKKKEHNLSRYVPDRNNCGRRSKKCHLVLSRMRFYIARYATERL